MTEAKNLHYEIIHKNFHNKEIDIIRREDDFWMTAEMIGLGLEYKNPRISIIKLYNSHKDEIEDFTSVIDLVTEAGIRKITIFNEQGVYFLIIFSNQPEAMIFRRWVVSVIKQIRKTGSYLDKSEGELIMKTLQTKLDQILK